MAEEVEDNDNLEPVIEGVSNEPPAVFAAGQAPVNLAKKNANKLDWMMPDYAEEDARGEGKAIAGLAEELQSAAAQTVSMQGSDNGSVRKAPPVTFAEEFQSALQSAPALDLQQMHQPADLALLQQEQALLQRGQSGAQAVLPPAVNPAVPAPLHVDHSQHQSIDEFKAAPSSIHFLKPPEGRVLPPEPAVEESATQFVPLPELPRSLDKLKLNEAGPIAPAPTRPVYSKKSDGSEKLVSPDRLQSPQPDASESSTFAPAIGQAAAAPSVQGHDVESAKPGYAPPAPQFAPPPANFESQQSQSQSANLRQAMQAASASEGAVPSPSEAKVADLSEAMAANTSQSAPNSVAADDSVVSTPVSTPVATPAATPRKSRLPRSIAAPDDVDVEPEPVPHSRPFRKLPPSRTSATPLPIERSLQSPSSKVAIIIAVSVLVGAGVGVGFLANIKKPADTPDTAGSASSGLSSSMPAGRSSAARTIDAASLLGTKGAGGGTESATSANFAPVDTRNLKSIDEARDAGAKQLLAGNYEGARKCYTAALAFDGHDMTSLHKRGLSNYLLGSYAVALIDLNKVLERDHRYIPALLDRAAAYYKLGEYKKAQADYDLVFAVDRGNRFALLGLSLCKSKQNLSEEALKTLSRLTFGDPGYVGGYEAAGYEFIKTGDYQRAAVAFSKALNVAPNSDSIYALRARSYLLAGDKAHAIEDYNKAIALCKDPASAVNYKHDLAVAQGAN